MHIDIVAWEKSVFSLDEKHVLQATLCIKTTKTVTAAGDGDRKQMSMGNAHGPRCLKLLFKQLEPRSKRSIKVDKWHKHCFIVM